MTVEASTPLSRPRALGRLSRRAAAATLVLASSIAGLALVEGLTRLALPAFDPSGGFDFVHPVGTLALGVPGTQARQTKNTGDFDVAVRINRHGLRDDNDIAAATPDDFVVVGDSVAWGWGVDARERFSEIVQDLTGRRTFNLSTPTDIDGYAALLTYARSLGAKPGRVVVAVSMETDLRDYATAPSGEPARLDLKDWLSRHSAAYLLLTTVVHRTPWLKAAAVRSGLIVPNLEGISRHEDVPEIVETSADRLQALAGRHRLLAVLIPSRALWVGDGRAVEDRVHRGFAAALAHRGIEVLDLRPMWEVGGQPLAYHFVNDGHWNAGGHRLAGEAIARRLAE